MAPPSGATAAGRAFNGLRNAAKRAGRSTDELMVLYVLERFLYRLSKSSYRTKLILKGGLLLSVLDARRTTRDIDLLAAGLDNDEQAVVAMVGRIAEVEVDDGVEFDVTSTRTEPIRADDLYAGVRVVMSTMIGQAKVKLALAVNFGDPVTPGVVMTEFPQILDGGTFPILGYPVETVLAEKITTMVALGDLNTRDRDWADVWRLTSIHDVAGSDMQEALARTARHRGVVLRPLSQLVSDLPRLRRSSYGAWRARHGKEMNPYPLDFAEVVRKVNGFADLPLAGSVADRIWSAAASAWRL